MIDVPAYQGKFGRSRPAPASPVENAAAMDKTGPGN
jgi:hypothetical protein